MTMEMTMDEMSDPEVSGGLTWLDGMKYGYTARWRVSFVHPDTQEYDAAEITARSVWLGPGGTLIFKTGDANTFVAAYAPGGWDTVQLVSGSTARQAKP